MKHDQSGPLTASRWTEITWPLEGKRQTWKPGQTRGLGGSCADCSACDSPSAPRIFTCCIASLFQDFRGADEPAVSTATAELHRRVRDPRAHGLLSFTVLGSGEAHLSGLPRAQLAGFPVGQTGSLLHQIPHLTFCCLHGLFLRMYINTGAQLPLELHKYIYLC